MFALRVPSWSSISEDYLVPENLKIFKVSGSLTNAVFFISYPAIPSIKTVLLRIYGPASSSLISRPRELHTLHVLSSQYRIGPRVHGTFENGRVEEYFESDALTSEDLRDPTISRWIGARMAELHCVDIGAIEDASSTDLEAKSQWDVAAKDNVRLWLKAAMDVLLLPSVSDEFKQAVQIEQFVKDWERYMVWLSDWEQKHGHSKRVFAHNDTQYGNLLRLRKLKEGLPEHRQIIVVDFEYASPNSAAFDIANHFQEWTANYHGPTPHLLEPSRYPSLEERTNFCRAYVSHTFPPLGTVEAGSSAMNSDGAESSSQKFVHGTDVENEVRRLESQVRVWSPATHAMWAVWGIVQAREDLEQAARARAEGGRPDDPEFDYLGYARCRLQSFEREIRALGL
ncbi:kinase-like protein [Schizopora paradoxa]|uniref:Kinase-like protein n=1 Tax=Schizopora paradoxa TaxID=27342 RepID=A0A0H2S8E2_9AGAM|nr:kinase-like protein [Schizopora paradoxa]